VLITRYWGIVTVPESFLFRGPGVAGSSPSTLTTSLATPVWQEEEFEQIFSRELLTEKAADIEKTFL